MIYAQESRRCMTQLQGCSNEDVSKSLMTPKRTIRARLETLFWARWLTLEKRVKHGGKCGEIWEEKRREVRSAAWMAVEQLSNFLLFDKAQSRNNLLSHSLLLPARTSESHPVTAPTRINIVLVPPLGDLLSERKLTSFSDRLGRHNAHRATRHISPTTYLSHLLQTPPSHANQSQFATTSQT